MDMELGGCSSVIAPMSKEQIFYKVCEIMRNETLLDADVEIHMSSKMEEDLGLDSLDMVDLAVALRHELSVDIPDTEFYKLNTYTVGMLCELVEREMAKVVAK